MPLQIGHFAAEFEPLGQRVALGQNVVAALAEREICGLEHHRGEEQFEHYGRNDARQIGANHSAGNGRAFEDHRDPQVGPSIAHEGDAGASAGRDHGNQARANGDLHRHVREHDQRRNDEDTAAEARECADEAGADRQRQQVNQDFEQA